MCVCVCVCVCVCDRERGGELIVGLDYIEVMKIVLLVKVMLNKSGLETPRSY